MKINPANQVFTPVWAAEILYDRYFGHLTAEDLIWEPTCGTGSILASIPSQIPCIGTELDPVLAKVANDNSKRAVIHGNCLTVELPKGITAVFGNPPFELDLFFLLLNRCENILDYGKKAGFILPYYFFQTSNSVLKLSKKWTIDHTLLPRDLFPGLIKPIMFANFIRENNPELIGFYLYKEVAEMRKLAKEVQEALSKKINGSRGVWKEVIKSILIELGGTASLDKIYSSMEGKRPTSNQFWKEKVRQVLQHSFVKVDKATYSLN